MFSKNCLECSCKHYTSMGTISTTHKDIMVVGDIPSAIEARKNVCMTGGAVDILTQTMKEVGLPHTRDKIHFTTAIKCAVPKRAGKALPVEPQRACTCHIRQEISLVQPKLLLLLGATAVRTFLGDPKTKITALEGRVLEDAQFPDTIIVPIKHPANIMRSPNEYKPFRQSLELVATLYHHGELHDTGTTEWVVLEKESDCEMWLEEVSRRANICKASTGKDLLLGADIETTALDYREAEFCVLGICYEKNKVLVLPREMRHMAEKFFRIKHCRWVWQHGKYDTKVMWRRDLGIVPLDEDTIYMHYVLDETSQHDLGYLTKTYLQAAEYKYKMNQQFKAVTLETYDSFFESLCERVSVDADYTYQLVDVLGAELAKEPKLEALYHKLMIPAAQFLTRVEQNGILINPTHFEDMSVDYTARLANIQETIISIAQPLWDRERYMSEMEAKSAPEIFNPASPKQMAWMIYKQLKLKPRIRKGMSTAEDVLESIEGGHPLITKVLEYRKVAKEHSTYVKGLLKARDADGRIRSNFGLHITATGRLSSKEPNVQNLPSYFGVGNVRRGLIPRKGYVFMEVDYSGAELRWLACLSGCPILTKIFVDGINLHDYTAEGLYGPNFTKQDRMRAKAANFGIMYGREAQSFVDEFNISLEEAQGIVNNWLKTYPGAKDFLQKLANAVVNGEYLETPFGRRRRFGLVTPESLHALQNEARNFPIQSSSSDSLLMAAMELEQILYNKYSVRIINLIHDSMLLEVPAKAEIIQAVSRLTSATMIDMPRKLFGYEVPFESDSDIGFTWGDLSGYNNVKNTVSYDHKDIPLQEWLDTEGAKWAHVYEQPWYAETTRYEEENERMLRRAFILLYGNGSDSSDNTGNQTTPRADRTSAC